MEKRLLGRTGLSATIMGLGCGGHSRLGISHGKSEENAVEVVRRALDLGINLIDTAEGYRTEPYVGQGIAGRRDEVILATKISIHKDDRLKSPEEIEHSVDESLRKLDTDRIDIYQVHGLRQDEYDAVMDHVYPVLVEMRDKGKIRFIGVTEVFGRDTGHRMLSRAVQEDAWDVIMVGFNFLNPSAREFVLREAQRKGIGTLDMFAVRKALTDPQLARDRILGLVEDGRLRAEDLDLDNPLGFLLEEGVASSLAEAGYRFCVHESGIDVVLSGTGSIEHLEQNARSLQMPPLPEAALARLERLFGDIDCIAGN